MLFKGFHLSLAFNFYFSSLENYMLVIINLATYILLDDIIANEILLVQGTKNISKNLFTRTLSNTYERRDDGFMKLHVPATHNLLTCGQPCGYL